MQTNLKLELFRFNMVYFTFSSGIIIVILSFVEPFALFHHRFVIYVNFTVMFLS